jgi:RND family efflux transporter MFP subunit
MVGCGGGAEAKPAAPAAHAAAQTPAVVPVKVRPAQARELQRTVRVVGSLAGLETVTISNRVTGVVGKIHADMGDRVQKEATLLEIVPTRFTFLLQEEQASQAQTLARLGLTTLPKEVDISKTAPVRKAQSELDNAQSKFDRIEPLYKQGIIKQFEYIDAESALKVAQSALEASRDEARALVEQARQHEAQISIRTKDKNDATITAPDGSTTNGPKIKSYAVTARKVSTGEYLREGTMLFTLVADDTLKLQARVPERYLGAVAQGAKIVFHIEAFRGEDFEAKVHRIDPSVDPANRTFMLEALVENGSRYGGKLRPGSFVQGEVLTRKDADRLMVPIESVISFAGVMKVFVVRPGADGKPVATSVEVATGQQEGQWMEILPPNSQGELAIKPGDPIVYEGMRKLVDGNPVRIQETAATEPGATKKVER